MDGRDKGSVEKAILLAVHAGLETHPLLRRVLECNRVIKHNFRYNHCTSVKCALEGCNQHFPITLIPRQLLYPKYCEAHRNEYQRRRHLRKR